MFNSRQYDWSNVEVLMLGRPVTGVRGIEYNAEQEKEAVYGRGNNPLSLQKGNRSYSGSITLLQSEIEALQVAAGNKKDILDLPAFDVVIAYVPQGGGDIITDIVKGVEFTSVPKSINQNDKFMEVALPFIALKIEYNV